MSDAMARCSKCGSTVFIEWGQLVGRDLLAVLCEPCKQLSALLTRLVDVNAPLRVGVGEGFNREMEHLAAMTAERDSWKASYDRLFERVETIGAQMIANDAERDAALAQLARVTAERDALKLRCEQAEADLLALGDRCLHAETAVDNQSEELEDAAARCTAMREALEAVAKRHKETGVCNAHVLATCPCCGCIARAALHAAERDAWKASAEGGDAEEARLEAEVDALKAKLATARRDAIEECARVAKEHFDWNGIRIAGAIRALATGGKRE